MGDIKFLSKSMSNVQQFTDPIALIQRFEEIKNDSPVICLFTGAVKPETGESWCPYCVLAKGALNKIIEENKDTPILVGIVARDEWMGKPHPFKTHWQFKAKAVPTVGIF